MRLLGRKRKIDQFDDARTQELRLPELRVASGTGDENHFVACLAVEPNECPLCHQKNIERKESKTHIYNDAIPLGDAKYIFDELTFVFSKYRCTNPECRHVFTPPITFADTSSKGTYRFYDAVAVSVMNMSYRRLSERIPFSVTAQALGNTFRSWYESKNAKYNIESNGTLHTPSVIGIFISSTQKQVFTILLDCDNTEAKVLDVVAQVGTDAIVESLSKYDRDKISSFVISCSQLVAEILKAYYPEKQVYVPGWFLYESALTDYRDFITTNYHNLTSRERKMLHQAPIAFPAAERDKQWVDSFLRKRQPLQDAFDHVQSLGYLIDRDWDYSDLFNWAQLIPAESEKILRPTEECVLYFKDYLVAGRLHQDELPSSLYQEVGAFNQLIETFDGSQPEVLRARILFANFDQEQDDGEKLMENISLRQVNENLAVLHNIKPRTYNRRRHRNVNQ